MSFIGRVPANAALTASDLADGIVTTDKLAADAVTDAKIADDVVGTEHLTANEVDTAALAADAVTAAQIADDAISEEHLDVTSITGHSALTSVANDDLVLISDTSASAALKKMTVANLVANAGGGKIGQIVSTTKLDSYSASVASAAVTGIVTGFTVAITPSASNSKILIILNVITGASGEHGMRMQLFRDTTQIDLADASSSRGRNSKGVVQMSGGSSYASLLSTNFLDAPNSTSELVYGIKIGNTSSGSQSVYVNRSHSDDDNAKYGRSTSTITVMEVLA